MLTLLDNRITSTGQANKLQLYNVQSLEQWSYVSENGTIAYWKIKDLSTMAALSLDFSETFLDKGVVNKRTKRKAYGLTYNYI